eukprot:3760477-Lingulodinium_polyedra.AAC.1
MGRALLNACSVDLGRVAVIVAGHLVCCLGGLLFCCHCVAWSRGRRLVNLRKPCVGRPANKMVAT